MSPAYPMQAGVDGFCLRAPIDSMLAYFVSHLSSVPEVLEMYTGVDEHGRTMRRWGQPRGGEIYQEMYTGGRTVRRYITGRAAHLGG